jgi:hypothetical protein
MTRSRWLITAVLALLITNLVAHWWKNRGLITIDCEDWPATKVVKEIERQGGITVKSNLTDETKIRMHVNRVPVAQALETLATVAEARWRLAYFFAGGMADIQSALNGMLSGNRPEGWKTDYMPLMGFSEGEPLGDPRTDPWNVKPVEKSDFQTYAHQAALSVSASMTYPEAWNPGVNKALSSGPIGNLAPQLAKAAGGKVLEVFLVQKPSAQPQGQDGDSSNANRQSADRRGGGNNSSGGEADRERLQRDMAARTQAEIDKLPPEKRAAAQEQFDERRKFFESMRDLTPMQRMEKVMEFLSNDANLNRIEARMNDHMGRMTPDQRVQMAQKYIQSKEEARSKTDK